MPSPNFGGSRPVPAGLKRPQRQSRYGLQVGIASDASSCRFRAAAAGHLDSEPFLAHVGSVLRHDLSLVNDENPI